MYYLVFHQNGCMSLAQSYDLVVYGYQNRHIDGYTYVGDPLSEMLPNPGAYPHITPGPIQSLAEHIVHTYMPRDWIPQYSLSEFKHKSLNNYYMLLVGSAT